MLPAGPMSLTRVLLTRLFNPLHQPAARFMATNTDSLLTDAFSRLKIDHKDHELVESLLKLSQKSPKLVKFTQYPAPADPSVVIRSWKMNEWKYYDIPSPFPTLARGLFTREVTVNGETKHVIVVRGYDKFFNIGEVPWTTVSPSVQQNSV